MRRASRISQRTLVIIIVMLIAGVMGAPPASARDVVDGDDAFAAPLLLIHGFNDDCAWAFDRSRRSDDSSFDYATSTVDYLAGYGFRRNMMDRIGYYRISEAGDTTSTDPKDALPEGNCQTNLNQLVGDPSFPGGSDMVNCNLISRTGYGTKDDRLERLSCLLAWYIYHQYTKHGMAVNVLAHSMGGLLIRAAIGGAAERRPFFPSHDLAVLRVVTVGSPHGGIGGLYRTAAMNDPYSNGAELDDMEPGSSFMNMVARYQRPQGAVGTRWVLIGSSAADRQTVESCNGTDGSRKVSCYLGDGDGVVPADSQMGMRADTKILYGVRWKGTTATNGTIWYDKIVADLATQYEHEIMGSVCYSYFLVGQVCFRGPYELNDNNRDLTKAWMCRSNCDADAPPVSTAPVTAPRILQAVSEGLAAPIIANEAGAAFATFWDTKGGVNYGMPLSYPYDAGAGRAQDFHLIAENTMTTAYGSVGMAIHEVHGGVLDKYVSLNGPAGFLGFPTSDTSPTTDGVGRWNSFQNGGYIYWSPDFGAHATWGPIREKWTSLNWENGFMGYPVSDVQALAPGEVAYFAGSRCGNGGPNGSGSAIYTSPTAGTHEMHGCIFDRYQQLGATSAMGFPLSDDQDIAGGRVSYVQGSQCGGSHPYGSGGAIYASSTGAWRANGCIYDKYLAVGGPGSAYSFPVNNEADLGGGRWVSYLAGKHCGNGGPNGSGSAIYFSGATGAHTIQGCVYDRYWRQGGPDRLGLPLSDEQTVNGGWVSYVQGNTCGGSHPYGSGGAVYHAASGVGGRVNGCIFDKYVSLGESNGGLGFPVSDEIQIDGAHWVSYFAGQGPRCTDTAPYQSGSAIYSAGDAGTHEVHGCIYARYVYLGGPTGSGLGYPTSDERLVNGAPQSDFQCGNIRWVNGAAQINRTCNQPGYFAPSEYVWDRNSTSCPGNDQFFTATDGTGAPIHWTYANGSNRCVTISYNPDTSASANCRFEFYVPNAHATGQIAFKFFYTEGDAPKTFTNWVDENPVSGWQTIGQASNVYRIEFTDANGQTAGPQLGWGADANHGIRRSC
ncbi:hypothetical protein AB0M47_40170 [Hamadaea sp. NPDC051192]|uniref:hypothetical protein n=1 Tax=Hamadaea sp. NPDC051192 TaxID=3154940 RepID=UPI0034193360